MIYTARPASEFTKSVGINTHLGYWDTVYNWGYDRIIKPKLLSLGVSHIRDGTFPAHYSTGSTVAERYRELGLGLVLLTGLEQAPSGPGGSGEGLPQRLNWIKAERLAPLVVGLEGSNESWNDATVIRNVQCELYRAVKNDLAFISKPVIGPSTGPPFSMTTWYDRVGDLSACVDKGNLHSYPGEHPPHTHQNQDLLVAMEWGTRTYGRKPYWATESGYWTKSPDGSHISEKAAGIYIPRLLLEYFRRGVERTQLYELIDLNTEDVQVIHNYGLLRTDGTPKPAYTKLKRLLRILHDTKSSSGSLDYNLECLTNCHNDISHLLLKHSSGAFFVVMWTNSNVWNGSEDTPQPTQKARFTLAVPPAKVEVFSIAERATPIATYTMHTKAYTFSVTDNVRVIKVTP